MCVSVAEWSGYRSLRQQVSGSNVSHHASWVQPWASCLQTCPLIKQYNLVPATGQWYLAVGKVTVGVASHWPRVADINGSPPAGSGPRRWTWAPAYALKYDEHSACHSHWYQYESQDGHQTNIAPCSSKYPTSVGTYVRTLESESTTFNSDK